MRTARILGITCIAVTVAAASIYAFPQGGGASGPGKGRRGGQGGRGGHERPMIPPREVLEEAGATEAQIDTLQEFSYDQREKAIDQRANVERAQLELRRLMTASDANEKAIMRAADELHSARGEMFKQHIAARLKIKEVLGEDVVSKLREHVRDRVQERRGSRQGGRRSGPPRGQWGPPSGEGE